MRGALPAVIWFSSAAGTRMSQSTSRSAAVADPLGASGYPTTVPCSRFHALTLVGSRPAGLWIPPVESLTAMMVAPSSCEQGGGDGTGVAVALDRDPGALERDHQRGCWPAAGCRPRRGRWPRCDRANRRWRWACRSRRRGWCSRGCMEKVSMIQAMVCAFVLTSGAGMSRSGPMSGLISVAKRRVRPSSSRTRQLLGVDDDAALAAAVGDVHDRALPGHPHRQGANLVERDVLVVADAALGRAAATRCAGRGSR